MDDEAFAAALVDVVSEHIGKVIGPLLTRIEALEAREIPVPERGPQGERGERGEPGEAGPQGEPGPAGRDGKDADPDAIAAHIDSAVAKAVSALPPPKDGQSVTLDDVRPMIEEAVQRAVSALPRPKDGVGLAGAMIDRSGSLVLTLSDGTLRDLGVVVGKDGEPGQPGADGKDGRDGADGKDGRDGIDGLGFDDLEMEQVGERGAVVRFSRGEVRKEFSFSFPALIYRGLFRDGTAYEAGDTVTWSGHLWHCNAATTDRPDANHDAWTMAVKRGRDGKDGIIKEAKAAGPVRVGVPQNAGATP